jgi:hypothetical protein
MKDAYYFPHDSNATNDPKIMLMIAQWGLEAYGIYWTIIEHLREQPKYISHLKILKALAQRYSSTEEKYFSVVKSFGLFTIDDNEFFSASLKKRMKSLDDKRKHMKAIANKRWSQDTKTKTDTTHAYALHTQYVRNASKVEKSKEDNIESKSKLRSFIPPTLDEIKSYIAEKKYSVDPLSFYNYFSEGNWTDSKGRKVKNWKQKIITWESHMGKKEIQPAVRKGWENFF